MTRLILILLVAAFVLPGGCGPKEPPWPTIELDASPSTVAAMARANNEFGLDLFRELYDTTVQRNVLVSPTSISVALTMLWNGARGTTRDSLAEVLRIAGFDTARVNPAVAGLMANILSETDRVQLEVANAACLDEGYSVYPEYRQTLIDFFNAELIQHDLQSPRGVAAINRWVAKKTHGMIKKLVSRFSPLARLCLLNAVYFDGKWTHVFDPKDTRNGRFVLGDGSLVEHPFMNRTGRYGFLATKRLKAIRLPYGTGRFALYIFVPGLPREYELEAAGDLIREKGIPYSAARDSIAKRRPPPWWELNWLVSVTTVDSIESWIRQMHATHLPIGVPKFEIDYADSLRAALIRLGAGIMFDSTRADLTGIAPGDERWVDMVLHKCVIEVDEAGTRAAAATAVGVAECAVVFSFAADRPCLYLIRDDFTGAILFIGTLVDPRSGRS